MASPDTRCPDLSAHCQTAQEAPSGYLFLRTASAPVRDIVDGVLCLQFLRPRSVQSVNGTKGERDTPGA